MADAEMVESSEYYDTIHIGSYTVTNVYKPLPSQWLDAPLPNYKLPAIYMGDFNSHHTTWGYDSEDENASWLAEWASSINLHLVIDSVGPFTHLDGTEDTHQTYTGSQPQKVNHSKLHHKSLTSQKVNIDPS
jgi:hypothetical protein